MGIAGAFLPALLNSRSSRPNASRMRVNNARTLSGLLTSATTGSILPPAGFAKAAVASKVSVLRPAKTTENPAACKPRLTARPIPLPAPVTNAIRFRFIA